MLTSMKSFDQTDDEDQQIDFVTKTKRNVPRAIFCDQQRFEQVLFLLVNLILRKVNEIKTLGITCSMGRMITKTSEVNHRAAKVKTEQELRVEISY